MRKMITAVMLMITGLAFGQSQTVNFANDNILNRTEWYRPNSPTNMAGNREVVGWIKSWDVFYMTMDTIRFSVLSGAGSRMVLARPNGDLYTVQRDTAGMGINKTGSIFSVDMGIVMAKSVANDSISALNSRIASKMNSFTYDWSTLPNKPSLFDGQYSSLSGLPTLFDGNYTNLTNKPTLFSGAYGDLTGKPSLFSGNYSDLIGKPTLFSGSYLDLTNKPTLFSGSYNDLTNKPTIPTLPVDYVNNGAVAGGSGNVVFYLTSDKTSTGTALFTSTPNIVIPIVNDSGKNYTYGWTISGDFKTLTVNTKAVGTSNALLNLLGGLLPVLTPPVNVANGTVVYVNVK